MPSRQVTRKNYRRADCCGTCRNEDRRYCARHCMQVRPEMVCDDHAPDPKRASARVACRECAFGAEGDHSCADGCRKGLPPDAGCYAGRRTEK